MLQNKIKKPTFSKIRMLEQLVGARLAVKSIKQAKKIASDKNILNQPKKLCDLIHWMSFAQDIHNLDFLRTISTDIKNDILDLSVRLLLRDTPREIFIKIVSERIAHLKGKNTISGRIILEGILMIAEGYDSDLVCEMVYAIGNLKVPRSPLRIIPTNPKNILSQKEIDKLLAAVE